MNGIIEFSSKEMEILSDCIETHFKSYEIEKGYRGPLITAQRKIARRISAAKFLEKK